MKACTTLAILLLTAFCGPALVRAQAPEPTFALPPQVLPWGSTVTLAPDHRWGHVLSQTFLDRPTQNPEPALPRFQERARRDGSRLLLKVDGGRSVSLFDEGECLGFFTCLRHSLYGWWPEFGLYIVTVAHGEGGWAYLIRESDGMIVKVVAPPILSPGKRYAFASVINMMDGIELQLIDMQAFPPALSGRPEGDIPRACLGENHMLRMRPAWLGDSHITFEGEFPNGGGDSSGKQLLRIVNGKLRWEC